MQKKLEAIAELSRFYGADPDYVFLSGGNASVKDEKLLYIKPSGAALASLRPEQFIAMDRETLGRIIPLPETNNRQLQEQLVSTLLQAAVRSVTNAMPSVETPLHNLIQYTYVLHLHPAMVNGMTCSLLGQIFCRDAFPEALWIDYFDPGYALAAAVKEALDQAQQKNGRQPQIIFLRNHGVFIGAESTEEITSLTDHVMSVLKAEYSKAGISDSIDLGQVEDETVMREAPALRTILAGSGFRGVVRCLGGGSPFAGPATPDHVVYAGAYAYEGALSTAAILGFEAEYGFLPKILKIEGGGLYAAGRDLTETRNLEICLRNSLQIQRYAQVFGGISYMDDEQWQFIANREQETCRRQSVQSPVPGGRLHNRVCMVTGGAQGFGYGIADYLAANGGIIVIADMNAEGARKAAETLCEKYGRDRAESLAINISDEESVQAAAAALARLCGGLDLLVANAGVLRAGSVLELSKKDWDFVTNINYTGYFLCVKHFANLMKNQIVDGTGAWSDIVQVNSKSGLEGSNKNGAYAGSKFGTVGLTQSFAKELVTSRIKVNSVCPGNYYDGPLWSDPEKGLFVQYLQTGKVPGAQTVQEVKDFYEAKVPMHRGCVPADVARAILYCVEQEYETGQAIPVTGGQVMLH